MIKTRDGSENNDHWRTPKWLYDQLDAEFNFNYDPCPLRADFDGLALPWGSSTYCNPPYNRYDKPKFIRKAYAESLLGKTVVMLIPASVSTKEFHEIILPHAEIRFLKARIAFEPEFPRQDGKKPKGKHDSMIVIFRGKK